MANRIIRSRAARLDVAEIWFYLDERSPAAAERVVTKLDEQVKLLAGNPMIGRGREELAEGLRSFVALNYTIFYKPLEDGVQIVRILHNSRDVSREFEDGEGEN